MSTPTDEDCTCDAAEALREIVQRVIRCPVCGAKPARTNLTHASCSRCVVRRPIAQWTVVDGQSDRELERQRDEALSRVRCADAIADEVAVLVRRKVIDSRSPAADALLDYREPPSTERADRLAQLEAQLEETRESLSIVKQLNDGRRGIIKNREKWARAICQKLGVTTNGELLEYGKTRGAIGKRAIQFASMKVERDVAQAWVKHLEEESRCKSCLTENVARALYDEVHALRCALADARRGGQP